MRTTITEAAVVARMAHVQGNCAVSRNLFSWYRTTLLTAAWRKHGELAHSGCRTKTMKSVLHACSHLDLTVRPRHLRLCEHVV